MIPSPPLGTDAAAGLIAPGAPTGADPAGAAAERRFRFELAAHPGSPAQARRLARARLTAWSVCEDTCDTADLVISELVTNAIVHTASSRVVCELHDGGELVRIAVRDEGRAPGEPHPSPQRPEEEHGRGLLLVEAMCLSWGAQQHGQGLVVWAELARTADTTQAVSGLSDAALDPTYVAPDAREVPDARDTHDTGGAQGAQDSHDSRVTHDARGDLGWGARPKPYPIPDPHPHPAPQPTPQPAPQPTPQPAQPAEDEDSPQGAHPHRAYAGGMLGSGAVWL